jgi:hypothetical protein
MKNYFFGLIAAIAMIMISCSTDDASSSTQQKSTTETAKPVGPGDIGELILPTDARYAGADEAHLQVYGQRLSPIYPVYIICSWGDSLNGGLSYIYNNHVYNASHYTHTMSNDTNITFNYYGEGCNCCH